MAVFKGSSVRYYDSTNQKFVRIQGSQATGSDYTLQLPPNVGGADQVLKLPSATSDTNQLVWGDAGGDSSQTVLALTPQGTTAATTSQAIYGVNLITTATTSALATRLPDASTGKQVTFVNTSTVSILVFPSVTGGKINGVVDGYASIPNDGTAYTFTCIENPLPGAWTWSPPAVNQFQFPTISVAHTNGTETRAYGCGGVNQFTGAAQIINPQCPDPNTGVIGPCPFPDYPYTGNYFMAVGGGSASTVAPVGAITFNPQPEYWKQVAPSSTGPETITQTKIYSNFLRSDTSVAGQEPVIQRYISMGFNNFNNESIMGNYYASKVYLSGSAPSPYENGLEVTQGPLSSPAEVGDLGTVYSIQPANTVQNQVLLFDGAATGSEQPTDYVGMGPVGTSLAATPFYQSFGIFIPAECATKTYEFDIFIEHT